MNTHYEKAKQLYKTISLNILEFGAEAMQAVDDEGQTLRQMSIDLCGNESLEDRLSRWVQAARWQASVSDTDIYKRFGDKFSPSHLTEYYRIAQRADMETAMEVMNDTIIRDLRIGVQIRPVEWVRTQGKPETVYSSDELIHRAWTWIAKALPYLYSELESKGNFATEHDRRRLEILKAFIAEFSAEQIAQEGAVTE